MACRRRRPVTVSSCTVDVSPVAQKLIGSLHRHATKVRDKVRAICVASDIAFGATTSVLASNGEHVSTMAAPISSDVGYRLKAMGNAMIDFLLISISGSGFRDTLCDDLFETLLMTRVPAVLALIPGRIE